MKKIFLVVILLAAMILSMSAAGCMTPQTRQVPVTNNDVKQNVTKKVTATVVPNKKATTPTTTPTTTPSQTPAAPTPAAVTNWAQQQADMREGANQYTPKVTPTAKPTATPHPATKTPTTITGNKFFNSNFYAVVKGMGTQSYGWGFEVVATGKAGILSVPVTVTIDGKPMGTVTPVDHGTVSDNYVLSAAETTALDIGPHHLVVTFAGNSVYAPSTMSHDINIIYTPTDKNSGEL